MRSKTALMISFFMLSAIAFSQTEKGTLIVSGKSSLEFIHTKTKISLKGTGSSYDSKVNSFDFMPAVGYFVADNFAVAFSGNYSHSWDNDSKSNQIILMPTLMYYIPLESSFRPYIQAGFGYVGLTDKDDFDKYSYSGYAFGVGLGLAYFISDNISVDLGIQWIRTKLTSEKPKNLKTIDNSLGSVIGFTLFF